MTSSHPVMIVDEATELQVSAYARMIGRLVPRRKGYTDCQLNQIDKRRTRSRLAKKSRRINRRR